MTKILVVEDDFFLRDGLSELLTKEGYEPVTAQNAAEAQARLTWDKYSLIILDVMLPDGSGLDICTALRSRGCGTPVLFLTACDDEIQIVRGLDSGADDYVTKPFRLQELLSRIRALLRRSELADKPTESGGISLERSSMTVRKNRRECVCDTDGISNSLHAHARQRRHRHPHSAAAKAYGTTTAALSTITPFPSTSAACARRSAQSIS